jgi:carbon-monoxide dehydrogenase large subunit
MAYIPMFLPAELGMGLNGNGVATANVPSFPNGCHICEVEIDPDTGEVNLDRYTVVDDIGTIINPLLAAGQIHGGVVQGIAQALYEEVSYDGDTGQLMTGSLLDYAVPRAEHVPSIRSLFQETPSPTNPIGVKGIGENGSIAAPPCMVHAVLDALSPFGIKHLDMPMTPPRVWSAIQNARNGAGQ